MGTHALYKGRFFLIFYDKDDENVRYIFDNVRDILRFTNQEITRKNVNKLNIDLYRALSSESHICRFINGETLRVYMILDED